jgi:acetyl esterase/lipase
VQLKVRFAGSLMLTCSYTLPEPQASPTIRITPLIPPCFFTQAHDDRVHPENSVTMYLVVKRAGISADLHLYAIGSHEPHCVHRDVSEACCLLNAKKWGGRRMDMAVVSSQLLGQR